MWRYLLFGLRVGMNMRIPFIKSLSEDGGPVDVQLLVDTPAPLPVRVPLDMEFVGTDGRKDPRGHPWLTMYRNSHWYLFRLRGRLDFYIAADGRIVRCTAAPGVTAEETLLLLLGKVFSIVLHLRRIINLHSSSVMFGKVAVAIVGPSGGGKSTLASSLVRHGHKLLSDDLLALSVGQDGTRAYPSFPSVKLCEDAAGFFFGAETSFPRAAPGHPKVRVSEEELGGLYQQSPAPLVAVFSLHRLPPESSSSPDEVVRIQRVYGSDALVTLVSSLYTLPFLGRTFRISSLQACAEVCASVAVYEIYVSDGLDLLTRVRMALLREVSALCSEVSQARECIGVPTSFGYAATGRLRSGPSG